MKAKSLIAIVSACLAAALVPEPLCNSAAPAGAASVSSPGSVADSVAGSASGSVTAFTPASTPCPATGFDSGTATSEAPGSVRGSFLGFIRSIVSGSVTGFAPGAAYSSALGSASASAPASAPVSVSGFSPGSAAGSPENAVVDNKEEVVYASLGPDGSSLAIYAVNRFAVAKSGNITDYGRYSSVKNLTSTGPLRQNGDSISFFADKGNFYYQGNMAEADLPWKFKVSYYFDGAIASPQDLAGKSGKLEMHIAASQNKKANPVFYENYMLQISLTLDTEKFGDIEAPGAMVASSGKNKIITYMVLPGKDGDFSLSSTVRDFAMDGIQITAMPFNLPGLGIETLDAGKIAEDMTALSDAISDLSKGAKKLADGAAAMKDGAGKLARGSAEFAEGLSQLSGSSGQLIKASGQINSALSEIAASLNNPPPGGGGFSDLAGLSDGLGQLSRGLGDISAGMASLKNGLASANVAMERAVSGIPDISQADIESLSGSPAIAGLDKNSRSTFNQLLAAYSAARTVKGAYYGPHGNDGVKAAFDTAAASLETMRGSIGAISQNIAGISAEIKNTDAANQVRRLTDGLTALSDNYRQFNSGLIEYASGVKKLSSNYGKLHGGLASLSEGTAELYKGAKELSAGTSELNDSTAALPKTVQAEIDNLLKEYDKSDFKPVSFVSEKNGNVSLVQFVFKTAAIEEPPRQKTAVAESGAASGKITFLDRLLALFRRRIAESDAAMYNTADIFQDF